MHLRRCPAGWLEAHTLAWDEMLPLLQRAGALRMRSVLRLFATALSKRAGIEHSCHDCQQLAEFACAMHVVSNRPCHPASSLALT